MRHSRDLDAIKWQALFGEAAPRRSIGDDESLFICEHTFVRCEFCGSPTARWHYPALEGHGWRACERCHKAIQADDREALLDRVVLMPVPRTLPDRYAPRFRQRARELHEAFWLNRAGPPRRLKLGA